ncbi:MAG: Manganese transport system ATP-binding protein MntB [Chlamydiia bacterium]|nr:Manganese transport system ATP-binding protein MntB [Chlamydiia bacterium]
MSKTINVESLTVHYDSLAALIDVSVELQKGKLTAIVGPNGAGKSTFVKAILNLTKKTSGKVLFFGKSFDQMKHKIAYVCQTKCIDWDFPITVKEVVLMGCYARSNLLGMYKKRDLKKCDKLLEKFGLLEKKNALISELSGGQRQRLFIARAYMQEAEIYIFDEPMAFVDYTTSEMIIEGLKGLRDKGKTVICVHHNLTEVKKEFDEVVLLAHYLVSNGTPRKVLTQKNLERAYHQNDSILTEAFILSKEKECGQV